MQYLIKQLLIFCILDTNYVSWNSNYYKQNDGFITGSTCSSIIVDWVISDLIESVMVLAGFHPKLIIKYVEDIQSDPNR